MTDMDIKKESRILFMGTPDIARSCLEQLIEDEYNIVRAFTREDKPVGRKQVLTRPPVKEVAITQNIPVYQPKTLKGETVDIIKEIRPDMIVVVAYGRILPQEVIDIPKYGCINLHVSLLPKYRGAAPIQWALINGDGQTGVSVMFIDRGLDTGDVIDVLPIDIDPDENRPRLFDKVAKEGKVFLSKVIGNVMADNFTRTPQDHNQATLAPPLTKEMAMFTFDEPALVLHNKIRGQYPWPGAQFVYEEKNVKVTRSKYSPENGPVGQILNLNPLTVACKEGSLQLLNLSPAGSKPMTGTAWAAGRRLKKGDCLIK